MENEKKVKLPRASYIFFGFAALSLIVFIIAIISEPFADFFNRYIASFFRGFLAIVTGIIPLSFAELFIITLPVSFFFIVRYSTKKYGSSWRDLGIFCLAALSLLALLFSIFVFTFGTGYHTTELDKKLELEKKTVTNEELVETAEWLIAQINAEVDNISFAEKSSSDMPYDIREMNELLLDSYSELSEEYDFLPVLKSYIKPIMLSEPMTYTHISGVYTFMTGEANLNTNAPDYCIPYTTAHELAHQRGIAREDEANFIAFLVCINSEDAYIRYSGYLNVLEYVLSAIYSNDKDLWEETYKKLDNDVIYEMIAMSDFYEKYQDNIVGDISGAINDTMLQINGTEGSRSYGLVVDLAVAYFHKNIEN